MKLTVRRIEAPGVPGGYAFALCDDAGEMLPMQRRCIVDTGIDSSSVLVDFYIDGESIRLGD